MLPMTMDTAKMIQAGETVINRSLSALAASASPRADVVLAEITMLYKLDLINYHRREVLMAQAKSIAGFRAQELRRLKNAPVVPTLCWYCSGAGSFQGDPCELCKQKAANHG